MSHLEEKERIEKRKERKEWEERDDGFKRWRKRKRERVSPVGEKWCFSFSPRETGVFFLFLITNCLSAFCLLPSALLFAALFLSAQLLVGSCSRALTGFQVLTHSSIQIRDHPLPRLVMAIIGCYSPIPKARLCTRGSGSTACGIWDVPCKILGPHSSFHFVPDCLSAAASSALSICQFLSSQRTPVSLSGPSSTGNPRQLVS